MKKKITLSIMSACCFSVLGIHAQGVATDFSQYEGTQIYNSDFEDWSGKDYPNAPVGWHSFETVGGNPLFVSFAKSKLHTSKNTTNLHDGTTGKSCLKLVPRDLSLALANGTITTGRMNAGAGVATDSKNHAWMDISNTESADGHPYYALLNERPTALSVWVKFTQGTPQAEHPYATVSAAITNGKRYQEPTANNDSSVVIGYAQNKQISTNGGQWQHLYVPFRYNSKNFNKTDEPKAIMVTFSTNADPGQGSAGDVLLIDDLELVYTQTVTIPESGVATLTNVAMKNHKVVIPEGITAYTLEANAQGDLMVKDTYQAGQVLPYHAAVLLKGAPGSYDFLTTLYGKEEAIKAEGDYCMVPASELNTPTTQYKYYRLGTSNGVPCFQAASYGLKVQEKEALLRVKSEKAAENYPYVYVKPQVKGDLNDDGRVNITDATLVVTKLLGNNPTGKFFLNDSDVNEDRAINISDVVELVNIILHSH